MFYMDLPPIDPVQHAPVMVAEASIAQPANAKSDLVIGVCMFIRNPVHPKDTTANLVNVPGAASAYLYKFERKNTQLSGTVSVLQKPVHGSIKKGEYGMNYHPEPKYYGADSATLLLKATDGSVVKAEYSFKILRKQPSAKEGYNPYEDRKLCPNGHVWKIPNTDNKG